MLSVSERRMLPLSEPAAAATGSGPVSFAVLGDCQPPLARMPYSQVTQAIMRELRLLQPDFALFLGDRIWGFGETAQGLRNGYDRFRALAGKTGVPFYAVPGNHECQSDRAAIALLESLGPPSYGSFGADRYHFIGLNTEELCLEGRVTGEQLAWLEADLAAHSDAPGVFVFMHRPLFSWFQGDFNPDDSTRLQELFRSHPVRAVFAGHDHFYAAEEHDDIRYFTVGGGGGTLYAQPPQGGYSHYLLVYLDGEQFDVDVIDPGRLQVDYVAGNNGLEPITTVRVMNTTERSWLLATSSCACPGSRRPTCTGSRPTTSSSTGRESSSTPPCARLSTTATAASRSRWRCPCQTARRSTSPLRPSSHADGPRSDEMS